MPTVLRSSSSVSLGNSTAISNDGTLILGGDPGAGAVRQWTCDARPPRSTSRAQPREPACAPAPSLSVTGAPPNFGAVLASTAVASSSTTAVVVGAPGDGATAGAAYLYAACAALASPSGCDASAVIALIPRVRTAGDLFGASAWVSSEPDGSLVVFVGSPGFINNTLAWYPVQGRVGESLLSAS
jgi:hypothetical protein